MATAMMVSWCQVTPTSKIVTLFWPNSGCTLRFCLGDQMIGASAMRPNVRPMETTTRVTSEVPCRPRKIVRSRPQPNAGASTSSTRAMARGVGTPQPYASCQ